MPSPAVCDPAKTWKAAASLIEQRLAERFGPAVTFEYAELFSPDMARHPDIEAAIADGEAGPPIVVIDGVRRFSGGKLNISAIERAVADAQSPQSATTPAPAVAAAPPHPHKDASQ